VRRDFRQMEFGFSAPDAARMPQPSVAETCSRLMGIDTELTAICVKLALMLGLDDLASRVGVEWNPRMRSTAGRATWPTALIELNARLPSISEEEVRRTLLHELAHLVTYERVGHGRVQAHGPEWQVACADLGIPGEKATHRLALPTRSLKRQWKYLCRSCGSSIERVRRFKGRVACYECCRKANSGSYDERFRLVEMNVSE